MTGILIEKIGFLKDGLLDTDVYPLTFYRIMGRGRGEERWERKNRR